MGFSLNLHTQQYNLSWQDCGFSLVTGLSGYPYANRHWELAEKESNWGHYAIACIQYLPLVGALASLIERITVAVSDFFTSHIQQTTETHVNTTDTQGVTQTTQIEKTIEKYNINAHAQIILKDYREALNDKNDKKVQDLLADYKHYAIICSSPEVTEALDKADFLFVHGAMHVSHVALMVPVMANFYKWIGDERAIKLTDKDILIIQIAALYHDYGRTIKKNDLENDNFIMENDGAMACQAHLIAQGFSQEEAQRAKETILNKDNKDLSTKDIYAEILQNCDCIAYIRAHDASFNPKYLDITERLSKSENMKNDREFFNQILDGTKLFLMSIGDSPDDAYKPLSQNHQSHPEDFKGRISLEDKKMYEKNSECFDMMQTKMREFEDLAHWMGRLSSE